MSVEQQLLLPFFPLRWGVQPAKPGAMTDEIWRADNAMRFDPVDQEWTIIARNRRVLKPRALLPEVDGPCDAGEFDIEGAIAALPNIGAWQVGDAKCHAIPSPTPLAFVEMGAPQTSPYIEQGCLGAHELLALSTSRRYAAAHELSEDAFSALLSLWSQRVRDLAKDTRLLRVGFSLAPPSARRSPLVAASLLALAVAPKTAPSTRGRGTGARECCACEDFKDADQQHRVLLEDDESVAWVPFAPKSAAHIRVATKIHGALMRDHDGSVSKFLGAKVAACARALNIWTAGACLSVEIAPIALRGHADACAHAVVDIVSTSEIDRDAFGGQDVRICALEPEEIARELRALLAANS